MTKRIKSYLRDHHVVFSISLTLLACTWAYLGAFVLRFEFGRIPDQHLQTMWLGMPVLLVIRMATLSFFRVHRGLYRYVSMHDVVRLFQAVPLCWEALIPMLIWRWMRQVLRSTHTQRKVFRLRHGLRWFLHKTGSVSLPLVHRVD